MAIRPRLRVRRHYNRQVKKISQRGVRQDVVAVECWVPVADEREEAVLVVEDQEHHVALVEPLEGARAGEGRCSKAQEGHQCWDWNTGLHCGWQGL